MKSKFKQKDKTELQKLLMEKRENLRKLKFDLASGKTKNIKEMRETRKEVARIMTELNKAASAKAAAFNKSTASHAGEPKK